MNANSTAWILLLLPMLVAIAILPGRKHAPGLCSLLATGSAFICLLLSLALSLSDWGKGDARPVPWIFSGENEGAFRVIIGLELDRLSRGMVIAVAAVGFAVQVFFLTGMRDNDKQFPPFAEVAFFLFSATGIVFSDGLVMLYFFFGLSAVGSFLFISHWYPDTLDKANFLIGRFAASGFLIGLLLVGALTKSIYFHEIFPMLEGIENRVLLDVGVSLLFFGIIGQAIQLQLCFFSPTRKFGIAWIHTTVILALSGYALLRIQPLIAATGTAATVIIWIGGGIVLLILLRNVLKFIPRKS